jgi:thioesterase domain-containing protein
MLLGADLRIGPDTTFLLLSPLSFDPSVIELWGTLLHGGTVALAPRRLAFLEQPVPILRALRVTTIVLVPQQFNLIVDRDPRELAGLHNVLVGGDVISPDHVRRAMAALPGVQIAHCYGPTENTVLATLHWVDAVRDGTPRLTLGRPTPASRVYVLDGRLRPVARGAVGELYLGGGQVARGYQGKSGLTAESFVADPFAPAPGARMYRTGDRVRMDATGALEFLGRVDEQIALRGFRVEPGEVEATLCSLPQVRTAVVRAVADRLVGYVVPVRWPAEPDLERRVLEHARRVLPAYLVPTVLVPLERLPLNAHGKPDRTVLPPPEFGPAAARPGELPADELESQLLTIWSELLGAPLRDPGADFFALGGTSLLALRLSALVEARTGKHLPLGIVFEARTVRETARALRAPATAGRVAPLDLSASGPGRIVVCLHPVGGSIECYRELATLLADRHHVLGLPDPALSGLQRASATLPERASALAVALAERQEPPYVLVGWSFGALLAYQIAADAAAGAVSRVVLLDPPTADGARDDGEPPVDEELEQLIRRELAGLEGAGPDPAAIDQLRQMYRSNISAGRAYRAPRSAVDLTVILAAQGRTDQQDAAAFWRGRTSGTVEVGQVPGDHFEVLTGSGLSAVARAVRAAWTG